MKVIETRPKEIGFVFLGHFQNLLDGPRRYGTLSISIKSMYKWDFSLCCWSIFHMSYIDKLIHTLTSSLPCLHLTSGRQYDIQWLNNVIEVVSHFF